MRTESACLRAGAAHRLSKCFVSRERSATRRPTMAALHLVFKAASSGSRRCRRRPRTSKPGSGEPKSLRFSVKSPQALGGVRRGRGCTEYASREGPPSGAACATLPPSLVSTLLSLFLHFCALSSTCPPSLAPPPCWLEPCSHSNYCCCGSWHLLPHPVGRYFWHCGDFILFYLWC